MGTSLTVYEWTLWLLNASLCAWMLAHAYLHRDVLEVWSPPGLVGGIFAYYVILGPLITRSFGDAIDRGVDMLPYFGVAWTGSLVALLSWIFGYFGLGARGPFIAQTARGPALGRLPSSDRRLWRWGIALNSVGVLAYFAVAGRTGFRPLISSFDDPTSAAATYSGAFSNYFGLAANFLIFGLAVMLLVCLRGRGNWPTFGLWLAVAATIYVTMGFRYRLVLLAGGMTFVYYLHQRTRPNLLLAGAFLSVFVLSMGLIGSAREYGRGLDLERNTLSPADAFLSAFGETGIFMTSGAVLTHVPSARPLVWLEPAKQALLMPLPSRLYAGKDTFAYALETLTTIYGPTHYQGAAFMFFAEAYQMLWWPGIVLSHIGLGWLCRWLWQWYRRREGEPPALVVYACAAPYLYVVFSRGHLPQIVMLFAFSVGPAIALYRLARRSPRRSSGFGARGGQGQT
jgi:hypothetical protein